MHNYGKTIRIAPEEIRTLARPLAGEGFTWLCAGLAICIVLTVWAQEMAAFALLLVAFLWYRGKEAERWAEQVYRREEIRREIEQRSAAEDLEAEVEQAQEKLNSARMRLKQWVDAPGFHWDTLFWRFWMAEGCDRKPEDNKVLYRIFEEREQVYAALFRKLADQKWQQAGAEAERQVQ